MYNNRLLQAARISCTSQIEASTSPPPHSSGHTHIEHVVNKVSRKLGVFRRLRISIPMAAAERLYKTMILPIFDYCDVAWHGCGKVNSDVLESLQHRAAKLRLLPTFRCQKNRFFFNLTKFKSVILSSVYKRKMLKSQKAAELFRKNVISNKVNKLRRCHNLVNGRDPLGKFLRQKLIARIHVICIFLFTSRT